MSTVYLTCLIIGGLYSIISIVASGLLDGLDFDFDFDFGSFSLPIKPFTVMVFITVFGGLGLIALQFMNAWLSLIPAVLGGFFIAVLLYKLFYEKLLNLEKHTPSEHAAVMQKAEVVEAIAPGGYGKISFTLDGNIISGPAKEQKAGRGIPKGAKVYILNLEDNVYHVCEDPELYYSKGE